MLSHLQHAPAGELLTWAMQAHAGIGCKMTCKHGSYSCYCRQSWSVPAEVTNTNESNTGSIGTHCSKAPWKQSMHVAHVHSYTQQIWQHLSKLHTCNQQQHSHHCLWPTAAEACCAALLNGRQQTTAPCKQQTCASVSGKSLARWTKHQSAAEPAPAGCNNTAKLQPTLKHCDRNMLGHIRRVQ